MTIIPESRNGESLHLHWRKHQRLAATLVPWAARKKNIVVKHYYHGKAKPFAHRHKRIHRPKVVLTAHWCSPHALFWLNSYVTSHQLALVPQSSAKYQLYCTVYYITLNSNYEAHRVFKILNKNVESQNNAGVIWVYFFTFLVEHYFLK